MSRDLSSKDEQQHALRLGVYLESDVSIDCASSEEPPDAGRWILAEILQPQKAYTTLNSDFQVELVRKLDDKEKIKVHKIIKIVETE